MNRFAKGAIAGAAGIALLLSGAGSFALWNGTATAAAAGSVQSGTMTIATNSTAGTWTVTHGASGPTTVDISTFRAVPGDVLKFTQSIDITATGDGLAAVLAVDPASIKASTTVAPTASAELATALKSGMTVAIAGTLPTGITAGTAANTYNVTGVTGTKTVPVVVTLPFDSTVTGTTAQGGLVDLSALAITLTQK
jgi:alternate signal-mediated exported protein